MVFSISGDYSYSAEVKARLSSGARIKTFHSLATCALLIEDFAIDDSEDSSAQNSNAVIWVSLAAFRRKVAL